MADNKEALPINVWRVEWDADGPNDIGWTDWYTEDDKVPSDWDGPPPDRITALTDHATATAALSELRAEVERLKADAGRLDWLNNQYVVVRIPLRYGSKECFQGSPTDGDGEIFLWDIRTAIDAARSAASGESAEGG